MIPVDHHWESCWMTFPTFTGNLGRSIGIQGVIFFMKTNSQFNSLQKGPPDLSSLCIFSSELAQKWYEKENLMTIYLYISLIHWTPNTCFQKLPGEWRITSHLGLSQCWGRSLSQERVGKRLNSSFAERSREMGIPSGSLDFRSG